MTNSEQEKFHPSPEEVAAVVVTPEIFSDERIVRRVEMISVTVSAEEILLHSTRPDNTDPITAAREQLAGKAARIGANAVIGVETIPVPTTSGTVHMGQPTRGDASGHIGGKNVSLSIPLASRDGVIKTGGVIMLWGLAVVINY